MLKVVALRRVGGAGKGAHRQDAHLGRDADEPAVRRDGASHRRAVRMHRTGGTDEVVLRSDGAG